MLKVGFIGAGTVGTALAARLAEAGYPVVAATSRTQASAERLATRVKGCRVSDTPQGVTGAADLVFITTPDDAIAGVVAQAVVRAVRRAEGLGGIPSAGEIAGKRRVRA